LLYESIKKSDKKLRIIKGIVLEYKIFDSFLDAIFVVDRQLTIVYCNESAANLVGVSLRRMTSGQALNKLISFDEGFLLDTKLLDSTLEPTPYVERKLTSAANRECIVKVSLQKVPDQVGTESHWAVTLRDMTLENKLQGKYRVQLTEKEGMITQLQDASTQLEQYSKNLEFMVRQRTSALNKTNSTLKAILNSLGQGLLVFNEQGNILPIHSKACEDLFEAAAPFLWIQDILRVDKAELDTFKMWMGHLFSETIPFDSVKDLGPRKLPTTSGRHIELDFSPIRNDDQKISSIVLVATDKTEEMRAKSEADRERNFVKMVTRITRNRRQFFTFVKDAKLLIGGLGTGLADLKKDLGDSGNDFVLDYTSPLAVFLRALHTLKGGAATFSITYLAEVCHEMEDWLVTIKNQGDILMKEEFQQLENYYQQICDTLDVFLKQNEEIIGSFGTSQSRQIEISIEELWNLISKGLQIKDADERVNFWAKHLFCEPIINSLAHYDEVVLSCATLLNKQVSPIIFRNAMAKIFPENFSSLNATLLHAFRNAVDHGIEPSEERVRSGKPPTGLILCTFEELKVEGKDWIKIIIEDDGGGIDPNRIREKMLSMGLPVAKSDTDEEILQNVFISQLSTRDVVTEISGRGVGLDAIKYEATKMGGWVKISSVLGKGTIIEIAVPNILNQSLIEKSIRTAA